YKTYLTENMRGDDGAIEGSGLAVIQVLTLQVIRRIGDLGISMQSICSVLKYSILNIEEKEIQVLKLPFEMFVKPDLASSFQNLIRRNYESLWPEMLHQTISCHLESLPEELNSLLMPQNNFQSAVVF